MMDSIMALKNHWDIKYVHGSRFLGQSKNKVFVFKLSRDLQRNGMDLMKHMQVGGNMEKLFKIFDHVKCLKNKTIQTCHMYDNKYCKVLIIACCDILLKMTQLKKINEKT